MAQNSNKVSQLLTITQGQDCKHGFAGHFWLHEVWSYVSELKSSEALSEQQSQIKAILFYHLFLENYVASLLPHSIH